MPLHPTPAPTSSSPRLLLLLLLLIDLVLTATLNTRTRTSGSSSSTVVLQRVVRVVWVAMTMAPLVSVVDHASMTVHGGTRGRRIVMVTTCR